MRAETGIAALAVAVLLLAGSAAGGESAFGAKPTAERAGDKVKVSFAVAGPTDVEVAVLDSAGKVVRHLAAGVLGGAKPPPEPLKAGLPQTLEWDGQDDFGKPAAGGPFKVRVRAGTGVKFGRMIGEDPYAFGYINSVAVDEDGDLYVTAFGGHSGLNRQMLRVFAPDGRYLRTLIPFPADLKPEAVPGNVAAWDAARKAFAPVNYDGLNPVFYPADPDGRDNAVRVVSVSKRTGLVLTSPRVLWRMGLDGGGLKGPEAMFPPAAGKLPAWASPVVAVSPDGKYNYYSHVVGIAGPDPKWPNGRIYRRDTSKPGSVPEKFFDLTLPVNAWKTDGYNCRSAAYHVVIDAQGHVYIGDLVNQEIVEVDTDGKKVSATKVAGPERVHVDGKSGAYYVLSRTTPLPAEGSGLKLVKIVGRGADAKVAAELPLTMFVRRDGVCSCLARMGDSPALWIGSNSGLICVKDSGGKLEIVETGFKPLPDSQVQASQLYFGRIDVDPKNEDVYINNNMSLSYRFNGLTGEGGLLKKNGKPFLSQDISVGYDGLLYAYCGGSDPNAENCGGPLGRFDRELNPVPYPATGTHLLSKGIYGRRGVGLCMKGIGPGPDGRTYEMDMYGWCKYMVWCCGADGKGVEGPYLKDKDKFKDKAPYPVSSAIVGPLPAEVGALRVDIQGNLYVGMLLVPKNQPVPPASLPQGLCARYVGSIWKFPPSGGTVLGLAGIGVKNPEEPENPQGPRTECNRNMTVVGSVAAYPGLAPLSGLGACVCRTPRFGVDRYGRLFYPNAYTNSATIIDNAGNRILEFGAYGNFDSQYVTPNVEAGKANKPKVAVPEFPMAWPVGVAATEEHVYVADVYNGRVLRADKTWKSEETCEAK